MIAIGAVGGGVDKMLNPRIAPGDQHVEKAGDIGRIGGDGILQRPQDAAEGGVLEAGVKEFPSLPELSRQGNLIAFLRV